MWGGSGRIAGPVELGVRRFAARRNINIHVIPIVFIKEGATLVKPNYQFQKRQKELQKKKKMEEKRQRKLAKGADRPGENPDQPPDQGETAEKDG